MEIVNDKFYVGFEGEPEIQFISKSSQSVKKLIIWEGYFDEIMRAIEPEKEGWTGLAYYYNMYTGWYDESPWKVKELDKALAQFEGINSKMLKREAGKVLEEICFQFKEGITNNLEIFIERE